MPSLKIYDLFISHAWKYGSDYERLVNMLDNANNFYYRNYSAPKDKPLQNLNRTDAVTKVQISYAIERKIAPVNAVIVISGLYANNREWMLKEITTALNYNKPIIAIKPYGNSLMPSYIQSIADICVNWNTDSIVSAIRQYSL